MPSNLKQTVIINRVMFFLLLFILAYPVNCQNKITTPKEHLGFNVGDDYCLINYTQLVDYWKKLEKETPRMRIEVIGKTEEGRDQYMAIITSPENFKNIEGYKSISKKLALAENLTDDEAKKISKKGKSVIWIDGGLHATEVVGANQLAEMTFRMISMNDEETLRFLDDNILLLVPANPDGMELVANWYMREKDPKKRSFNNLPRLYQKYAGHDNNRDLYMNSQSESVNMSRIMYQEWFPQIMYNHHQSAPADMVVFVPPFRDPVNFVYDPLLTIGIQAVGIAMHNRLIAENKPGAGMRSTTSYSIWYNGSLRTTGYFHNQIGILTEMNGSPTPMEITLNPDRQLSSNDIPYPIAPQEWHFRQSIEYSISLNKAILDYASRNKEILLFNRYLMGKNSIEKGNKDSWTIHPKIVQEVKNKIQKESEARRDSSGNRQQAQGNQRLAKKYYDLFKLPENRDPRGYIIPSDQPDFPTAVKFVNALIKSGIKVYKSTDIFDITGIKYPAGSLVIKCNQAFRPHILDLFEPQDHPNDFKFENGPPVPPYDNAGWTLALQMGVKFDRILDGFEGPFEVITGLAVPAKGKIIPASKSKFYLLDYGSNDAAAAVNKLLKENIKVRWLTEQITVEGKVFPAGTFVIESNGALDRLEKISNELGLTFTGTNQIPEAKSNELKPSRIALWDRYGGSMPSGWTRWVLEQFGFNYELVFPRTLNAGELKMKYDIIIFPGGAIPALSTNTAQRPANQQRPASNQSAIPDEFKFMTGSITADTTLLKLKEFLNDGGTIVAIGSSTGLAYHYSLPVTNHLVNSKGAPLPREEYYIPASILQIKLNNTLPIAYGLPDHLPVLFENSPVFRLKPDAGKMGVTQIGWFDSDAPLLSGWAWGQDKLYGGTAMAEAGIGKGKLYLLGPEVLFRGQSHAAFKLLFNSIYLSSLSNK